MEESPSSDCVEIFSEQYFGPYIIDDTQEAAPEVVWEAVREVGREGAREVAREAVREVAPEVVSEGVRDVARQVGREAVREAARGVGDEGGLDVARGVGCEGVREVAREVVREGVGEAGREVGCEGFREVSREAGRDDARGGVREDVRAGVMEGAREGVREGECLGVLDVVRAKAAHFQDRHQIVADFRRRCYNVRGRSRRILMRSDSEDDCFGRVLFATPAPEPVCPVREEGMWYSLFFRCMRLYSLVAVLGCNICYRVIVV